MSPDQHGVRYDAFISYAHEDGPFAERLYERLCADGLVVFLDTHHIPWGGNIPVEIHRALDTSRCVICILSPDYLQSTWVAFESSVVGLDDPLAYTIRPLLRRDCDMPRSLRVRAWLDCRTDEAFDASYVHIVNNLRLDRHEPSYESESMQVHGERLDALYRELETATRDGRSTDALRNSIVALKRELRSGPELKPGEHLSDGRYRLLHRIGQGGFGTVWAGWDRQRRRTVAVKVLHGNQAHDKTIRDRFSRGATVMHELHHPNVVRVFDPCHEEDGYFYYVMEYMSGGDLVGELRRGEMTSTRALEVVRQIGAALEKAHHDGYVHRDVKPSNILLDQEGTPKLSDFESVTRWDATRFTRPDAGLGTLPFTAPEARLDAGSATPASDVFSLGMTTVFLFSRDSNFAEIERNLTTHLARLP